MDKGVPLPNLDRQLRTPHPYVLHTPVSLLAFHTMYRLLPSETTLLSDGEKRESKAGIARLMATATGS